MRAVVVLAAAALLAGCTTRFDIGGGEWAKPGTQVPQVTQDEMECARTAVDARLIETILGSQNDKHSAYQDFQKFLQLGGKIEETRTRFCAAMPASRKASSKEVRRSRCFPTPLVKNIFLGTMSLPKSVSSRDK